MRTLLLGLLLSVVAATSPALAPGGSALAPRPASASSCPTHWVASWSAAPTDAFASQPPLEQTYRIKVVPHRSGTEARLRFSNRFGLGPVTFGSVTLGTQASGAAIAPGTLRQVTFAGAKRVRIARGADVVSDPVQIPVRPFATLLASVHVVGAPGPATQHVLAGQTTWQSPPLTGDRTRSLAASGFVALPVPGLAPAIPQAVPYLSGFDVRAAAGVSTVVAFGDSITDGFQGTLAPVIPVATNIDLNARYPDFLARRVLAAGLPFSVVNAGISGNQLLKDSAIGIFGPAGLSRLAKDGLGQPGAKVLILLEGINDIGQSSAKADALVAGYRTAIAAAHARGVRVLLGTLTPDEGTLQPGYGSAGEPTRVAVNAWIRTQRVADGIVDFDKAVRDPAHPARILPEYDGGDHLHFSPAGYRAMAAAVPLGQLAAWTNVSCR